MKKLLYLGIVCMFLAGHHIYSQTYIIQVKPSGQDLWGYIDLKGETILEAKYKRCSEFSKEGLAPVFEPGTKKSYFINLKGEELPLEIKDYKLFIVFLTNVPKGFEDGMALVSCKDKWGYIDPSGKLVIPAKYDYASDFDGGYSIAQLGKDFIVLDKQGIEHPVKADVKDVKKFSEGFAPFTAKNKGMGFIDVNGEIVIPANYDNVGYFKAGLAYARTNDGKIGYINSKGEWVIPAQFEVGKNFDPETGLALVRTKGEFAYVNKSGELLHVKDGDDFGNFSEGLAWIRLTNKKIGFINSKGEWAIQAQFDAVRDFKNGYAAAKAGDAWGIIDKNGNWIIKPSYDAVKDVAIVGN